MSTSRARARYLAALGLTAASGCHGTEPGNTSAPTVTVESAPPAPSAPASSAPATTAPPAAPQAHHTAPWVPAVQEPLTPPRPGIARCPQGPFCVPQPVTMGNPERVPQTPPAAGPSPAPEPYAMCSATVDIPAGIGPAPGGRKASVTFDAARTAGERASDPAACCYAWHVLCVGGRALRGPEGPLAAAPTSRPDWMGAAPVAAVPSPVREHLSAYWAREAAFEHASVAAFARASLSLLALGAPPDLIAATHAAAIDEVEHARLCYGLASSSGGAPRGPGPLPVGGALMTPTLVELAVETFVDGCAGEAAAALSLREAARVVEDGGLRAILDRIADDEERHAELAWRTVAWALAKGGAPVAGALRAAAEAMGEAPEAPEVADAPDLSAYGAPGEAARRAIRQRAVAEIVVPCLGALLAARAC
jgi:hypothetical protein